MRRELFIYWRTSGNDAAAARQAMRVCQQSLSAQFDGLRPRLLQRIEEAGDHATLMETYAIDGGIDAALQQRIVDAGNAASAPWRQGARHVEVFEDLDAAR